MFRSYLTERERMCAVINKQKTFRKTVFFQTDYLQIHVKILIRILNKALRLPIPF